MEIKKTDKADLDNKRVTFFLLGLNLVLALLFFALEFRFVPLRFDFANDLLDDMVSEMDMEPMEDKRDEMISAATAAVAPSITAQVKPVDEPQTTVEEVLNRHSPDAEGVSDDIDAAKEAPANAETNPLTAEEQAKTAEMLQTLPEFPGGMIELMKWLQKNLQYPADAQSRKVEGMVMVSFIINTDGTISEPKVEKGVEASLDYEALRVVKMMPAWKAGQENGKPCRTMFAIPIVFKL